MNVFRNTKKLKKFILIIVMIILFTFLCPNRANAAIWDIDIKESISDFFFWIERGVLRVVNNIFCDERHAYEYGEEGDDDTKIYISPETIIKGKFAILDPNIFEEITASNENLPSDPEDDKYYDTYAENSDGSTGDAALSKMVEGRSKLRETISGWYYALRNIAIIALLSILVYVGIRMIISTVSQDKAKYKLMLKDWFVALCLVMVMHYIMIATLNITSSLTNAIGTSGKNSTAMQELMTKIQTINNSENTDHEVYVDEHGNPTTEKDESKDGKIAYTIGDAFAYELVLLGVIGYTLIFAFKYLLRMMTIVFLILVAPITAITYPIDKISDGKAQAFNMWFQEFLYEVIIQPFHLLIYIVLIGSATTLAETNILYSIMCFAVMIPAEKFIKQMFGFKDKLSSPLGAFAGGALASQLISRMTSGGSKVGGNKDGGGNDSNSDTELPPNTKDVDLPGTEGNDHNNGNRDDQEREESQRVRDGLANGAMAEKGENLSEEEKAVLGVEDDDETNEDDSPRTSELYEETGDDDKKRTTEPGEEDEEAGDDDTIRTTEPDEDEETGDDETVRTTEPDEDEETGEYNSERENESDEAINNKPGRWERARRAANSKTSRHFIRKYGTTKIKGKNGIAAKMAKKGVGKLYSGAKSAGRKAIKGATTLAGAAALGAVGLMFGQGGKAAMVGASLGSKLGTSITNKTDKLAEAAESYAGVMHNSFWDKGKQNDKDKFKSDKRNIDLARQNYKNRHGVEARGNKLNEELENMYHMHSYGVDQNQYNDTLSQYEENIKSGMNDTEAMNTAMSSALQAQAYSAKDFKDEKTMKQAYENLYKQYEEYIDSGKISQEDADKKIRQILTGGAKMKGVKNPPLPQRSNTVVDIPIEQRYPNIPSDLGVDTSSLDEQTVATMNEVTFRLHSMGYSKKEIQTIASSCANSRVTPQKVIEEYKTKVEFLEDKEVTEQSREYVAKTNEVKPEEVTKKQVREEKIKRLELFDIGVKKEKIDSTRAIEDIVYKDHAKSEKQMAIKVAKNYSTTQMKSPKEMDKGIESLAKELKKKNLVTDDGISRATEIFERAAIYKDTTIATKYTLK